MFRYYLTWYEAVYYSSPFKTKGIYLSFMIIIMESKEWPTSFIQVLVKQQRYTLHV